MLSASRPPVSGVCVFGGSMPCGSGSWQGLCKEEKDGRAMDAVRKLVLDKSKEIAVKIAQQTRRQALAQALYVGDAQLRLHYSLIHITAQTPLAIPPTPTLGSALSAFLRARATHPVTRAPCRCAVMPPHTQPHTTTRNHTQPHTTTHNHIQPRTTTHNYTQPRTRNHPVFWQVHGQ